MNKLISFLKQHKVSITFLCDLGIVAIAIYLAFLIRFDGVIPRARYDGFLWFMASALIITPIVFVFFRLYRFPYSFISLTDLLLGRESFFLCLFLVPGSFFFATRHHLRNFRVPSFLYIPCSFFYLP